MRETWQKFVWFLYRMQAELIGWIETWFMTWDAPAIAYLVFGVVVVGALMCLLTILIFAWRLL